MDHHECPPADFTDGSDPLLSVVPPPVDKFDRGSLADPDGEIEAEAPLPPVSGMLLWVPGEFHAYLLDHGAMRYKRIGSFNLP